MCESKFSLSIPLLRPLILYFFILADSTAGIPIGDAIASVLREMVDFKLSCKKREVELQCQIKWAWKHEGILNILLQQSVMASVTEFIHP